MRKTWVYDPHTGGVKIPQAVRERTRSRILAYAKKHYSGKYTHIDVRFRGQLCYIDAYTEPYVPPNFDASVFGESREQYIERLRNVPTHLVYYGDVVYNLYKIWYQERNNVRGITKPCREEPDWIRRGRCIM